MAGDKQKKKGSHLIAGGTIVRVGVLVLLMAAVLYRPLPEKMTHSTIDKVAMHIIEPVLRLSYYYPSRLCPTAYCMMYWTRGTLNTLSRLIGPMFDWDPNLLMETTHWDGVKVRVYHPRNNATESDGAIIFIHGGGFVLGNTEMYESVTRTMAKMMSTRLFVSIDYRLAPETVFPGGLEDCEKVLEYVIDNGPSMYGVDPRKIVVMGDSAGGNLVAAITQRRRARKAEPKILGQVLLYPLLQMSDLQTYSYRYFRREMDGLAVVGERTASATALFRYAEAATTNGHVGEEARRLREQLMDYNVLPAAFRDDANGTDLPQPVQGNQELMDYVTPFLTNPDFAPMMQSDLSDLPRALIATCEFDVLRDEGAIYAHRLKEAGVPTQWIHYEHGFHAMLNFHNELEIARESLADIKEWTMRVLREAEFE
ncbi:trcs-1 [Pristionchus pacificus]|uniref:Alpha/beta hydrolase fold-3 domain-containing protein n=1 Tax=Pristionchus pacificus TaxID=54126 RepID=A0A8R1YEK8_PRIPA|nr:trcs-1 [Pristionchus pacificus]